MKQILITIAAVVLVGCATKRQSVSAPEAKSMEPITETAKPEPPIAKAPEISIYDAVQRGNIEAVKQHLAAGSDVNKIISKGRTLLHIAAENGQKEIVELIIDDGANINVLSVLFKYSPIGLAAQSNQKEIVKLLIAKGANLNTRGIRGRTPLDLAVQANLIEIANLLRKNGGKTGYWLRAEESIHIAVMAGHLEAVKNHLAAGTNVNSKGKGNQTPLHYASMFGKEEIVKLLISHGADVNAKNNDDRKPLDLATGRGHFKIADLIASHGGKSGREDSIHLAAKSRNSYFLKKHISNNINLNSINKNGETPLDVANRLKRTENIRLLRKHGGKTGEELKAGEAAQPEQTIPKEIDISIHDAAQNGDIEAVKKFLSDGIDVNVRRGDGMTPLHWAALGGYKNMSELLIAKGADVNAKNEDSWTSLHFAAEGHKSKKEIAKLLIDKGADVNAKGKYEETPLHQAAFWAKSEIAELLIAKGADVNAKYNKKLYFKKNQTTLYINYQTPLDMANSSRETEIADLLRKHGGKKAEVFKLEGK